MAGWEDATVEEAAPSAGVVKQQEPGTEAKVVVYDDASVREYLYAAQASTPTFCAMFYGLDGTAKSGIVQSYPLDLKKGEKIVIVDLDGGNMPLLDTYNEDKKGNIIVKNPMEMKMLASGSLVTDYIGTMNNIRKIVLYVSRNHVQDNIKAFCFDGLTKFLMYCEQQMRLDYNIDATGGVSTRYWLKRNKLFLETLEQIKALPIDTFFIAHEDFIVDDSDVEIAKVKKKTGAMMFQKIRCVRGDDKANNRIIYKAIIDKSKFNVDAEGTEVNVLVVNKGKGEHKWTGEKVFEVLKRK